MSKKIRSKAVRESLLDYNTLTESLRANTESAVKTLLDEAVRDTYAKLLSEDDDKDYEEEEVEDTNSDAVDNAIDTDTEDESGDEPVGGEEVDVTVEDPDGEDTEVESEIVDIDGDADVDAEGDGDEWAEFDKYKVSDDEYDFSEANDDEIVKVYKLMKDDDQIFVNKDDSGNVEIKDTETGAEYLIKMDSDDADGGSDFYEDGENDFDYEDGNDMNESTEKLFELVLEYDSNTGYRDNYQRKDVMTNPGMSETGKNVNDWDAGVPKGTEKPWSGYSKKNKKADTPFIGDGRNLEEEEDIEGAVEESIHTVTQNGPQRRSTTISQVPDTSRSEKVGRNRRLAKIPGQASGTGEAAYKENLGENFMKKANKILAENKELKKALSNFMVSLKEASVTNHNLGMIIKLISENTTSMDEKKEIISRFSKEAKTVADSKRLYESISRELKKSDKMQIREDKSLSVDGSGKINETKIYQSPDMLKSLDLMHRMG